MHESFAVCTRERAQLGIAIAPSRQRTSIPNNTILAFCVIDAKRWPPRWFAPGCGCASAIHRWPNRRSLQSVISHRCLSWSLHRFLSAAVTGCHRFVRDSRNKGFIGFQGASRLGVQASGVSFCCSVHSHNGYRSRFPPGSQRVLDHGKHRVGGIVVLVQEVRIALAVKFAPEAVGNRHQHLLVAAEGG